MYTLRGLILCVLLFASFMCPISDTQTLLEQGMQKLEHDPALAWPYFAQLVSLNSKSAQSNYNLAYVLFQLGLYKESIHWYKEAMQINPHHEMAIFGCAKALMALGDYKRGLPLFEWRFGSVANIHKKYNLFNLTPDAFKGKDVLLIGEMGFGDTLQCLRYALELKKVGANNIIVQAPKALHQMLTLCPYIDQIVAPGDTVGTHVVAVPMFSLMRIFNTTIDTIPTPMPYLHSNSSLDAYWHEQLKGDANFKIGITWHSWSINLSKHKYMRRSIPIEQFEVLTKIPGVSVYSLQKADGQKCLEKYNDNCPFIVFDELDESHGPFMDTLSIMKEMDLIISADTSIVHVAGALNVPVWTLLPYAADWRWLQHRTNSLWYPSMRLFRQKEPGNWQQVMNEIVDCVR